MSNPCIRCGTERIVSKVWEEQVGNSKILNREMICPNPECQAEVDMDIKKQNDRAAAIRLRNEQRITQRKSARYNAKM